MTDLSALMSRLAFLVALWANPASATCAPVGAGLPVHVSVSPSTDALDGRWTPPATTHVTAVGVPASASLSAQPSAVSMNGASASSEVAVDLKDYIGLASEEMASAKRILRSLDIRDEQGLVYARSIEGILNWLEGHGQVDWRGDARELGERLRAARLHLGAATSSLNHWLLVYNPEGSEIAIPERFVLLAEPPDASVPDYPDLFADDIVI